MAGQLGRSSNDFSPPVLRRLLPSVGRMFYQFFVPRSHFLCIDSSTIWSSPWKAAKGSTDRAVLPSAPSTSPGPPYLHSGSVKNASNFPLSTQVEGVIMLAEINREAEGIVQERPGLTRQSTAGSGRFAQYSCCAFTSSRLFGLRQAIHVYGV